MSRRRFQIDLVSSRERRITKQWPTCQFGLRTVFAITLFVSVILAVLASRIAAKRREYSILLEIENVGGAVTYLEGSPGKWTPVVEPASDWLTFLLGHTFFVDGVVVDLQPCKRIDGATLDQLAHVASIRSLRLAKTDVSDDALAPLAKLTGLEVLDLQGTAVSDAALDSCPTESLRLLNLYNCPKITPDGVTTFRQRAPQCEVFFP
jgi:hypothetical protein